jgi:hypothetical protein
MKALITKIEGLKLSPTFKDKTGKKKRVMIHYHLNIQLFTTLSMWQDGPPL